MLISDLKTKISCTNSKHKKMMILTLAPHSWTIDRTAKECGISVYLVKKARSLCMSNGILPDRESSKTEKELSPETQKSNSIL